MSTEQNRQQQWENILQLTGQLKQMLVQEDWESMTTLEKERQQLLNAYFTNPVSPDDAEMIAAEIRQLMHSTDEIIQDGQAQQYAIIGAVQQIATNRQAIKAYNKVQK